MTVEYMNLLDEPTSVFNGAGVTYDYKLPTTTVLGDNARKPIFSFMFSGAALFYPRGRIGLAVEANGHRIGFYRFSLSETNIERVIWEVDREYLRAGQDNTLHFEIDSGYGVVVISDVVLWYHTR